MRKLLLLLFFVASSSWAFQTPAAQEINLGVNAYKSARFSEAIEHFKKALELDPQSVQAHSYLATAYARQFMPGVESEENVRFAEHAIQEFKSVLELQPDNNGAIAGIASLYFTLKRFDEARLWYQKQVDLEPQKPEVYYSIAVIDWTQTYRPRMALRARLGLQPQDPILDANERGMLCGTNLPKIEEGIQLLGRAIEIDPGYNDAMAYLNLLYRERADCQSDLALRAMTSSWRTSGSRRRWKPSAPWPPFHRSFCHLPTE